MHTSTTACRSTWAAERSVIGPCILVASTVDATRSLPRRFAVLERHDAVDERAAIAVRPDDPPPFAAGQVMRDLLGLESELGMVVHDDVGRVSLYQRPAV